MQWDIDDIMGTISVGATLNSMLPKYTTRKTRSKKKLGTNAQPDWTHILGATLSQEIDNEILHAMEDSHLKMVLNSIKQHGWLTEHQWATLIAEHPELIGMLENASDDLKRISRLGSL